MAKNNDLIPMWMWVLIGLGYTQELGDENEEKEKRIL